MADQNIKVKIDLDVTEFNKNVKAMSDALSKVLGKDVEIFNGKINKTKKLVEDTDKALNNATSSINKAGNSLKQSNQQWTNLALVVQDLPFGFRGIQNNLPALLGGFAAVTGPIYLGISAVISAITIWDEKTRQAASAAKKLKEEQASLNDEILQSTQASRQQGILLKSYIDIANNATLSDKVRNEALEKANNLYGEHNEKLTLANINTEKVKKSVDGYIQSLIHMAVAQKYSDQVANNIVKTDKIQAQIDKKKEQSYALLLEYTGKQTLASRDVVDVMYDRRVVEAEIAKLESQKAANAQELITLTDKYSKSLLEATKLSAEFGKVEQTKKEKTKKEKDPFTEFERQRNERMEIINFETKLAKRLEEIDEDKKKAYDKAQKELFDSQVYFSSKRIENIKTTLDTELKINRKNLDKQREDIKNALAETAILIASTKNPEALQNLLTYFDQLEAKLAAFPKIGQQISDIINNSMISSFDALGQSIGEGLATGVFDFTALGNILADALMSIGKALISYAVMAGLAIKALKDPTKWKLALAAGIAAVAAGAFLKSKLASKPKEFANGGIISGPTYGLMGEYPGASSNPEVVAPLDKLKDMIGSGGGTLETRISGNDLLILINKANRNNSNTF
jgi:hypothetical protein